MATFSLGESTALEKERYYVMHRLEYAITRVIGVTKGLTLAESRELFRGWCTEEGGDLAITRLVNLIIY